MKACELLDIPEKFTIGALSRDIGGKTVYAEDESAVCWCVFGALVKCYGFLGYPIQLTKLKKYLNIDNIVLWNDNNPYEVIIAGLKGANV